jgi:tRNA uridine 5-carboxymethylaminomethyl modification enzyme
MEEIRNILNELKITPNKARKKGLKINLDGKARSAYDLLGYNEIEFSHLEKIWPELKKTDSQTKKTISAETTYGQYLERQKKEIENFRKEESKILSPKINYNSIKGLSNEHKDKLTEIKPMTLGQAQRIDGITPSAIGLILAHIRNNPSVH